MGGAPFVVELEGDGCENGASLRGTPSSRLFSSSGVDALVSRAVPLRRGGGSAPSAALQLLPPLRALLSSPARLEAAEAAPDATPAVSAAPAPTA